MKSKISLLAFLYCTATGSFHAQTQDDMVILDTYGVRNLGIEVEEATEQDFETIVFAIGRIEDIPANRSVLSSRIAGRVVELKAFEGDHVLKDQILAKVESRQLGDPPPSIFLKAPQDGLIIDSHVRLGQPVEPEVEMLDIADRTSVWAIAKIPEQEAAKVKIGSPAHIRIPALGDRIVEAKLDRFGVVADRQAGTVEGIFVLENPEEKLRPGMRAEFSIVVESRSNVLSVPKESIQGDPSNRAVFVKDFDLPNAFIRVPVQLGQQNDRYVEIVAGLFPGDEVVTSGSYLLGFAGGGSGISLKEALDAAHGHEHNEDGSEMTPEQQAERARERAEARGETSGESSAASPILLAYAAAVSIACLVLAQLLWKSRKQRNS